MMNRSVDFPKTAKIRRRRSFRSQDMLTASFVSHRMSGNDVKIVNDILS